MRDLAALLLRSIADRLSPEYPREQVEVQTEIPERWLVATLDAISDAAFSRAWPCKGCGRLQPVDAKFVLDPFPGKWVYCGPCANVR